MNSFGDSLGSTPSPPRAAPDNAGRGCGAEVQKRCTGLDPVPPARLTGHAGRGFLSATRCRQVFGLASVSAFAGFLSPTASQPKGQCVLWEPARESLPLERGHAPRAQQHARRLVPRPHHRPRGARRARGVQARLSATSAPKLQGPGDRERRRL